MSRLALHGGVPIRNKPFPAWPVFDEKDGRSLLEVLRSGKWWRYSRLEIAESEEAQTGSQHCSKVVEFEKAFAKFQGVNYAVACASGTAALEVALKALGVGPGDEVIVPPYTFVATASTVLMVNAVPIFADIEPDTFNLDPNRIEEGITAKTRAIIPVHFAGHPADMDAILRIAKRHNLFVIEDAAHGHGAIWKDKGLGAIGHAGAFSFQASKNLTAGEGGIVTTNNRELARVCESLTTSGHIQGTPWYEHEMLGWNHRMTEFQGALLSQQLTRLEAQNARRRENAQYLSEKLSAIDGIRPLPVRAYVTKHSYHAYIFRFDEETFGIPRSCFLTALQTEGIPCSGGYAHSLYKNRMFLDQKFYPRQCPLSCGPYSQTVEYAKFEALCPNAERACREAVWLEHRLLLGEKQDMDDIVRAICKIRDCRDDFKLPDRSLKPHRKSGASSRKSPRPGHVPLREPSGGS